MAVDIVIQETIDSVDITVNPNIIEVNVTRTSGGGGSQNLQQVTDEGATTTNPITVGDAVAGKRTELRDLGVVFYDEDLYPGEDAGGVTVGQFIIRDVQTNNDSQIAGVVDSINNLIGIDFRKIGKSVRVILPTNLIGTMTQLILPSKTNGNYTIATLDDVPTTTSQLTNDGADGVNPFITALDIPTTGQASTLVREVKNMTGATLTKGTVVFISGANGNKALVSKAIATTDALSARTFGLLQSDILNNGTGNCVIIGDLSGLDTSSFAEGAQLYLSGVTAGTYTSIRTLAPTHLVYIGKVTRSHPTQGQIEVQIQNGYELEEIHDCQIISPTNNQALIYETSTDLWKNKTIIEDAITNAVTDKAPSQNAVFDALALKQNSLGYTPVKTVVKDTAVSSSVTGTTTETILKSYTIAGGTFSANDVINLVSARFTKSGTASNTSTFKMYINTTNSLSGATQIAQLSGLGLYYKFSRTFDLRGGSLLGFSFTANGTQAGSDMGNSTTAQSSATLNPANTFYIIFSGTNAVSTDSILASEIYITN